MAKLKLVEIGAVLTGVLSRLVGEELQAWLPKIRERFVRIAVKHLPRSKRKRFAEEWRSHINDVPGEISKLITAIGFLLASGRISYMSAVRHRQSLRISALSRAFDKAAGTGLVLFWAPLLCVTATLIKLESRGPVLLKIKPFGSDDIRFVKYQFRTVRAEMDNSGTIELLPTRVGAFLKRTRLDELPMVLNLIRGDLSFSAYLNRMINLLTNV